MPRDAVAMDRDRHTVCSPRGRKRTARAQPDQPARLPGNAAGGRATASPGTSPGCGRQGPPPAVWPDVPVPFTVVRGPLGKRLLDFTIKDRQPRKCRNWATMLYKCRTAYGMAGRHALPVHLAVAALLR